MRIIVLLVLLVFGGCAHPELKISKDSEIVLARDISRAYERMQEPYILAGEDIGLLFHAFRDHLQMLGDEGFARRLAAEPVERIAAVRYFLDQRELHQYPETGALMERTPEPEFPAARMTEEYARED